MNLTKKIYVYNHFNHFEKSYDIYLQLAIYNFMRFENFKITNKKIKKYVDEKAINILPDIEDLFTKEKINAFQNKTNFEKFILSLKTTPIQQYSQD
jgi:hypothetical protein